MPLPSAHLNRIVGGLSIHRPRRFEPSLTRRRAVWSPYIHRARGCGRRWKSATGAAGIGAPVFRFEDGEAVDVNLIDYH